VVGTQQSTEHKKLVDITADYNKRLRLWLPKPNVTNLDGCGVISQKGVVTLKNVVDPKNSHLTAT
jgi:hypothetical protein